MKPGYEPIVVESFRPVSTAGRHGEIHIRPIPGQGEFSPDLNVRCSKELSENYPVGTKFKIWAKVTDKEGGELFIHSQYTWPFEVLTNA